MYHAVFILKQSNTGIFAGRDGCLIPNTGLNLTYVGTTHHKHTQSGLTDTATYSVYTYIYRNQNTADTNIANLMKAIYNYGESVKNI
jgi:hypothetical protein